jgi:hypothetical protein
VKYEDIHHNGNEDVLSLRRGWRNISGSATRTGIPGTGLRDAQSAVQIVRGNIRNQDEKKDNPNIASALLELIPNDTLTEPEPVCFSIRFTYKKHLFLYTLDINLGLFFQTDATRAILLESLNVDGILIFERNTRLKITNTQKFASLMIPAYEKNKEGALALAESSLQKDELFLSNGFKTMFSSELSSMVTDWFSTQFLIMYRSDMLRLSEVYQNQTNNTLPTNHLLNKIAERFG